MRAGEVVRGTDYGNDRRELKVIRRRPSSWEKRRRADKEEKEAACLGRGQEMENGLSFLSPILTMQQNGLLLEGDRRSSWMGKRGIKTMPACVLWELR